MTTDEIEREMAGDSHAVDPERNARVALMTQRYEDGLDIYSGQPLRGADLEEQREAMKGVTPAEPEMVVEGALSDLWNRFLADVTPKRRRPRVHRHDPADAFIAMSEGLRP